MLRETGERHEEVFVSLRTTSFTTARLFDLETKRSCACLLEEDGMLVASVIRTSTCILGNHPTMEHYRHFLEDKEI